MNTEWRPCFVLIPKPSIERERVSGYCMVRYVNGRVQYREMTAEEEVTDARERAW